MKNWLVIWKTWQENEVNTPWDFVVYDRTTDYKSRKDPKIRVPKETVNSIYLSYNADKVQQFEREHIDAVVLATVLKSDTAETAINEVKLFFTDAEIQNYKEISNDNASELFDLFSKE